MINCNEIGAEAGIDTNTPTSKSVMVRWCLFPLSKTLPTFEAYFNKKLTAAELKNDVTYKKVCSLFFPKHLFLMSMFISRTAKIFHNLVFLRQEILSFLRKTFSNFLVQEVSLYQNMGQSIQEWTK